MNENVIESEVVVRKTHASALSHFRTSYLFHWLQTAVLVAFLNSRAHAEKTTREIYDQNKGSVVLLLAYDTYGVPSALGSGFYFETNKIASNFHVVDRATRVAFRVIGSKELHEVKKIASVSKSLDLAVLEVDQTQAPARIAGDEKVGVGDKVVAIGNPRGLEGTVSEGIISAVRESGDVIRMLQITAPISPGSSGGPLFNADGDVIGVTTSTLRDSQSLNFAVPASLVLKLRDKGKAWEPMVSKELPSPDKGSGGVLLVSPSFKTESSYAFAYSLRNITQRPIKNISYLLIFKTKKTGEVLHFAEEVERDPIPPGLTKRFSRLDNALSDVKPHPEVELRVLNYDFVTSASE